MASRRAEASVAARTAARNKGREGMETRLCKGVKITVRALGFIVSQSISRRGTRSDVHFKAPSGGCAESGLLGNVLIIYCWLTIYPQM